jgi:N-carbamoylputrescine amidase
MLGVERLTGATRERLSVVKLTIGLLLICGSANPLPAQRTLRIAAVQMASANHDIEGNLGRATAFAETAAAKGAQLVVFPELMPTGPYVSYDSWDSAEPSDGKTVQWLKASSRRLHVWMGTSFLEAAGEDFFDTFVLTTPEGAVAGRVRKQIPAGPEAYFFRGEIGPHVIETAIGRIGIGICSENYYCFAASQMLKQSADLILMPHAAADMTEGGGLPTVPGTHLASWYAAKLGVPVAMVNKVGRSYKPPPNEIRGRYPGLSAIVDSDGAILQSMDGKEGVGIADVHLDPQRKTGAERVCTGIGIPELTIGGPSGAAAVTDEYERARKAYEGNAVRKTKARAVSGAK